MKPAGGLLVRVVKSLAAPGALALMGFATSCIVRSEGEPLAKTVEESCPRQKGEAGRGKGHVEPLVLQPDAGSQARAVNFGNDRDYETPAFAVKSDRAVDEKLVARLSLTADTFARTGNAEADSVTSAK